MVVVGEGVEVEEFTLACWGKLIVVEVAVLIDGELRGSLKILDSPSHGESECIDR